MPAQLNPDGNLRDCANVSDPEPQTLDAEAILSELLVLRCRRGDAEAWRQLVRHWERRLLYYLRRLLDNERDAWDVLQQVWLEVFRNLGSLRQPRALRPWLYRISHRRAITHRRCAGRAEGIASQGDMEVDQVPAAQDESDLWRVETAEQIHHALGQLSLTHREVLTLFFLEEMPIEEIAEAIQVPVGTVKSRLYYARQALRQVLLQEEAP